MIWAFFGLLLGAIAGLFLHFQIPLDYARYTAVVILGLLDAIFGAIRSEVVEKNFDTVIFASGLIFNAFLAIVITYLGERLGLNLSLAATIVFTLRIFQNVGATRRILLQKWISLRAKKQ